MFNNFTRFKEIKNFNQVIFKYLSKSLMTIIIATIIFLVLSFFYAKWIFIKKLKSRYEKSLINGDREKANLLGRFYYISLNEDYRKDNGIIDIEAKISADFSEFNNHQISLF